MSSTAVRRTERLIVREVAGETVVYDLDNEMVTVLDATTAAIWNAADGKASVAGVARKLSTSQDEVAVALVRLEDARLLKVSSGMSRRTLLKGLGVGAAVVPLMTVMAPPAYAAKSGRTISATQTGCNTSNKDTAVTVNASGFPTGVGAPAAGSFSVEHTDTSNVTVTEGPTAMTFTAGVGIGTATLKKLKPNSSIIITVIYNGVTDSSTQTLVGC